VKVFENKRGYDEATHMKATERLYPLSRTILDELATFPEF